MPPPSLVSTGTVSHSGSRRPVAWHQRNVCRVRQKERSTMRQDAWRSYLEMALGLTEASRKQATKAVKRVLGKGAVTTDQLQGLAEELLKTSAANREAITKLVRVELDRALSRVGLATAEEVGALNDRIRQLESELAAARVTAKSAPVAAAEPFGAAD